MNKQIFILIALLTTIQFVNGQDIPVPINYSVVDTVTGDLDKDSINELVVAYNTKPESGVYGVPRELIIYKLKGKKWKEWKRSGQALYGSRDGGMMSDPFGQIQIQNGILLISQNGGSSWKWSFTDKYQFQDEDFFLIGYTSINGKTCEHWREVDFNLTTGKMTVKKEYEDCDTDEQEIYRRENETLFEKGLKITLQNRQEQEIKIATPKYGHEIHIAVGRE